MKKPNRARDATRKRKADAKRKAGLQPKPYHRPSYPNRGSGGYRALPAFLDARFEPRMAMEEAGIEMAVAAAGMMGAALRRNTSSRGR